MIDTASEVKIKVQPLKVFIRILKKDSDKFAVSIPDIKFIDSWYRLRNKFRKNIINKIVKKYAIALKILIPKNFVSGEIMATKAKNITNIPIMNNSIINGFGASMSFLIS